MCAIAGLAWHDSATPPLDALPVMLAAMAHRGPDGEGLYRGNNVAFGHRRLAVIDPAGGAQPLRAGDAALAANAEIYNFPELRAFMPETSCVTGSDCEPALHLFRRDGAAFIKRLRGMYAIAAHDGGTGTLLLARDPFGIKPLYIAAASWGLAFASEPRALLAAGLAVRAVRPEARAALLHMQFSTGSETIFPDIHRVLPGETLHILRGAVTDRTHLHPLPPGRPESAPELQALAALDQALRESVAMHLRADVPAGLLLSGGIDSASLLAAMARHGEVRAFTAGFDTPGAADERAQAASVAHAAGARHETVAVTQEDFFRHLPAIVACMDDPAADYASVPLWFLARHAARAGVKVLLSGEGGDELFAGYGRYRHARAPWWRGGRRMRARGTFEGLGILRDSSRSWRDGWAEAERQANRPYRTRLQSAQAADIAEWLPNDLLIKLDRCLMAHGVEGRTPLLDPAVAAASYRLPDDLKVRGGRGKYLLRTWLAAALPAANATAPKQGFTVPVGAWMSAEAARLGPLVAQQAGIAEIADAGRVRALFTSGKHEIAAWTLLFYALWHRAHIEAAAIDGDVFETLAQK
jgi:asparagine synthase (glutamine-hydrolysing)